MPTLPVLAGAIFGTALFNAFAFFAAAKAWPMSVQKIVGLSAIMLIILVLGDNALRDEPMSVTFARIGTAQLIVTIVMLSSYLFRKPKGRA
jgi:hypothetical protein